MRIPLKPRSPLVPGLVLAGVVLVSLAAFGFHVFRQRAERQYQEDLQTIRQAMARGAYASARRDLTGLVARWPGRGEPLVLLGQCEEFSGRSSAARAAWEQVAPGDPSFAVSVESLGSMLINAGQYAPAESTLLKGLEAVAAGDRYPIFRALARLLRLQGRFSEVTDVLVAAWASASDPSDVLQELWHNDVEPIPAEGLKYFLDRADTKDDRVWLGQARLALLTGRHDEARKWLERCSERRPQDPAVHRAWLDLAREERDLKQFWIEADRIAAASLQPLAIASLRTWLAEVAGDRTAEQRELTALLAIQPASVPALERLAVLEIETGQPQLAKDHQQTKANIDRARDTIHKLVVRKIEFRPNAAEIARQATILGREFDARAWSLIAAADGATITAERIEESRRFCAAAAEAALARFQAGLEVTSSGQATTLADRLNDLRGELHTNPAGALATLPAGSQSTSTLRFVDDAASAGLKFVFDSGRTPMYLLPETLSGGVGLIDFDQDGWLDVYCIQGGHFAINPREENEPPRPAEDGTGDRLFRNRGDGTFQDVTRATGIEELSRRFGYGMGIAVGDYDNDGHADLFLTRLHRYALLRNRGDGTFEDQTTAAGLDGFRENPTSTAFADLDGDGDLDLYVCHYMRWDPEHPQTCRTESGDNPYYCDPAKYERAEDHVFRNDRGRFTDVTKEAGFTDPDGRGLGVVAADLDGDRRIDLFVANDGTANFLFHNLGGFRFEEIGHLSGAAGNAEGGFRAGMGVVAADVDGDDRLDVVVNNLYAEGSTLYRNLGNMLFADQSSASGLLKLTRYWTGFGVIDLDPANNGRLHLATANGNVNDFRPLYPFAMPCRLYEVSRPERFRDVSSEAGDVWEVPRVGRGLARGDLDNDGRMDLVVVSQNEPMAYFHNQTDQPGHFLTFQLEGTTSNRDAVGAEVIVSAAGVRRAAWRMGGGSYLASSDPRVHIGLGTATRVEMIEVRWPSGKVDRWRENLPANRGYLLREGAGSTSLLKGFAGPAGPRQDPREGNQQ